MSTHLSAREFVDALEGTLHQERRAHVAACDACTKQVAELASITRQAHSAGAVPEPSPLFWDRFSARVRAATELEPVRPLSWWERAWKPVVAMTAVATAATFAVVMFSARTQPSPPPVNQIAVGGITPTVEPAIDDGAMELMVEIASSASTEELRSARPGKDATASAIDDLTPEQQAEFIRLLKAEIGEQQ